MSRRHSVWASERASGKHPRPGVFFSCPRAQYKRSGLHRGCLRTRERSTPGIETNQSTTGAERFPVFIHVMSPTVNDVSSPRFFTPLPFEGGAAGPSGAAGGVDPHGDAANPAHGVKRDASQMMTQEERDHRVRKIVSLVKVLLTGTSDARYLPTRRQTTSHPHASPVAHEGRGTFGPRTVFFQPRDRSSTRRVD